MLKLRSFKPDLKIREDKEGPVLSGYGFQFHETTPDGCFGKERFSKDIEIDFPDRVFLLRDHDKSKVLARRGKNLTIETDDQGLAFSCDKLPNTPLAQETRELVKEGIIGDVSIGFEALKESREKDITIYEKIRLHEISILPAGYFESGKVSAREKTKDFYYPPECLC